MFSDKDCVQGFLIFWDVSYILGNFTFYLFWADVLLEHVGQKTTSQKIRRS